jgi:hypothetical protein
MLLYCPVWLYFIPGFTGFIRYSHSVHFVKRSGFIFRALLGYSPDVLRQRNIHTFLSDIKSGDLRAYLCHKTGFYTIRRIYAFF